MVEVCLLFVRARLNTYLYHYLHKQTDQTTTLCVQEVEIYLERWEVLGALVDVSVGRRKVTFSFLLSYTNINKGAQHYH